MRRFDSPHFIASDELLRYLQAGFVKDNDWAHSTLTQMFCVPRDLATSVLKKETKCFVHDRAFWIQDPNFAT